MMSRRAMIRQQNANQMKRAREDEGLRQRQNRLLKRNRRNELTAPQLLRLTVEASERSPVEVAAVNDSVIVVALKVSAVEVALEHLTASISSGDADQSLRALQRVSQIFEGDDTALPGNLLFKRKNPHFRCFMAGGHGVKIVVDAIKRFSSNRDISFVGCELIFDIALAYIVYHVRDSTQFRKYWDQLLGYDCKVHDIFISTFRRYLADAPIVSVTISGMHTIIEQSFRWDYSFEARQFLLRFSIEKELVGAMENFSTYELSSISLRVCGLIASVCQTDDSSTNTKMRSAFLSAGACPHVMDSLEAAHSRDTSKSEFDFYEIFWALSAVSCLVFGCDPRDIIMMAGVKDPIDELYLKKRWRKSEWHLDNVTQYESILTTGERLQVSFYLRESLYHTPGRSLPLLQENNIDTEARKLFIDRGILHILEAMMKDTALTGFIDKNVTIARERKYIRSLKMGLEQPIPFEDDPYLLSQFSRLPSKFWMTIRNPKLWIKNWVEGKISSFEFPLGLYIVLNPFDDASTKKALAEYAPDDQCHWFMWNGWFAKWEHIVLKLRKSLEIYDYMARVTIVIIDSTGEHNVDFLSEVDTRGTILSFPPHIYWLR